jgi:hypothetical protein
MKVGLATERGDSVLESIIVLLIFFSFEIW